MPERLKQGDQPEEHLDPTDKQAMLAILLGYSIAYTKEMAQLLENFPEVEATDVNPMDASQRGFDFDCRMAYLVSTKQQRPVYFWFSDSVIEIVGDILPYTSESGETGVRTTGTIRFVRTEANNADLITELMHTVGPRIGLTVIE